MASDDLARRLGEQLHQRDLWQPGMRAHHPLIGAWRTGALSPPRTAVIDLADPATAGVLLSLLFGACPPGAWIDVTSPQAGTPDPDEIVQWLVSMTTVDGGPDYSGVGATPGEATARALFALWEAE
jgi:hypothetical protein